MLLNRLLFLNNSAMNREHSKTAVLWKKIHIFHKETLEATIKCKISTLTNIDLNLTKLLIIFVKWIVVLHFTMVHYLTLAYSMKYNEECGYNVTKCAKLELNILLQGTEIDFYNFYIIYFLNLRAGLEKWRHGEANVAVRLSFKRKGEEYSQLLPVNKIHSKGCNFLMWLFSRL